MTILSDESTFASTAACHRSDHVETVSWLCFACTYIYTYTLYCISELFFVVQQYSSLVSPRILQVRGGRSLDNHDQRAV